MALKVCMFVYNNMKHDSRVLKEAKTLAGAGYDIRVIAVLDEITAPYEEQDGFRIIRVAKAPLHYKILKRVKNFRLKLKSHIRLVVKKVLSLVYGIFNFLGIKKNKKVTNSQHSCSSVVKWTWILPCYACRCARRVLYWGIRHPARIIWHRYLPKALCWGIYRPAKKAKDLLYAKLKGFLMTFHRPLCFLDYYYRSFRLVRNEPADIYHAHDLNTLPVAYWAKKRMSGKLVYDSHELFTETSTLSNIERVLVKVLEKYLIRRADRIITVNESIANELSKRYGIIPPTVIMNCPVITNRLNKAENNLLRQALRIDEETPIILYHGGFAPNRGLQNLVISGNYLDKGIIVFMGWGKLEQELKDLVLATGLGDKVQFAKPVPQRELLNYAMSATLGVIPYQFIGLNNYYTTPNKLFEYIAAGLPVVGSNFPELSKVIKEYNLGRTFNPDDPKDIAEAINYVLSDKDKYEEMKRNALQAAKVFNWENESKKLLEIYKKLGDELSITSN